MRMKDCQAGEGREGNLVNLRRGGFSLTLPAISSLLSKPVTDKTVTEISRERERELPEWIWKPPGK